MNPSALLEDYNGHVDSSLISTVLEDLSIHKIVHLRAKMRFLIRARKKEKDGQWWESGREIQPSSLGEKRANLPSTLTSPRSHMVLFNGETSR